MRHLENTGLLILSGFFFLFFQKPDYTFICAFLLSVGTCCAGYFSESKKLHLFLCAAFMAAALALPEMCAFFPAVFYVLIQDHFYLPALAGCFLYLYIIRTINSNIFLFSFKVSVNNSGYIFTKMYAISIPYAQIHRFET